MPRSKAEPLHLFDLYSDLPGNSMAWSPNTWKVRMVLNYKGIPYTQSWTSYPDIKPILISLGVPPNKEGIPYTLPAIVHKPTVPSNPYGAMIDSIPIALALEKAHPTPKILPSGDASYALALAVKNLIDLMNPGWMPLILPRVADHLDERGEAHFRAARLKRFGKPLSEMRPLDKESQENLWKICEPHALALTEMLRGREGTKKGVFFEGEKPGLADFLIVSELAFFERFDEVFFDKFMMLGNGELKALYRACMPWLEGQGKNKEWPVPKDV